MSYPDTPSDPAPHTLDLPGGRAAYCDEGDGRIVLAVHGLPGSVRDFRWLASAMSKKLRILRVDLPGFGLTPARTTTETPVSYADFLLEFMDALRLDRPIVLGHSMGGVYATALAHRAPHRVGGLALVSSPGLRIHRGFRRFPARPLAAVLRSSLARSGLMPIIRSLFRRSGFRGPYSDETLLCTIRGVAAADLATHATRIQALEVPTMAVWTRNDPLIEPDILKELAEAVPSGPRLVFDDGGHNPQKAYADQIADALRTWTL